MTRKKWYYEVYLKSEHWQKVQEMVYNFYGRKCMYCGETGVVLNVHHNNYECLEKETLQDVIPLCGRCHEMCPFPDKLPDEDKLRVAIDKYQSEILFIY